jgi:NADH-quinone oxidoreductase subunit N
MQDYWLLTPEVLVLLGALLALFGDYLPGKDRTAAYVGAALSAAAAVIAAFGATGVDLFGGMLHADEISRYVRVGVAVLAALWCLWVAGRGIPGMTRSRDAVALALFSASGGMLMATSADLITFYMALELSTMPAYVLIGYGRSDVRSLEGALKYFLLSLLTSLVMLYGLSFVYGLTGETLFSEISLHGTGVLGLVAAILVLVGLFAKLSAAPFHYWTPDAYEGSSAATMAFVSTVPKVAGAAALVRVVAVISDGQGTVALVIVIVSAASMILGNLAALTQTDMRRLMAYSGVAHSGYVLMAIGAASLLGASRGADAANAAAVFYTIAYAIPSMAIVLVVAEEGNPLAAFNGLFVRRGWVAWAMTLWLLSLIGIPPLAGFFGKLYVFTAALAAEYVWLVVIAVLASVVSAGYYFRIMRAMFFGERAEDAQVVERSVPAAVTLLVAVVAVVVMGLVASPLLQALGL